MEGVGGREAKRMLLQTENKGESNGCDGEGEDSPCGLSILHQIVKEGAAIC